MSAKRKEFNKHRGSKPNIKIKEKKENDIQNQYCKQGMFFSFIHLTKSSKYNLNIQSKNIPEKASCYESLLKRLSDLSCKDWVYWLTQGKSSGIESIQKHRIKFEPNDLELTDDTKVFIIRFNNQKHRILGIKKEKECSVLHIIGFDYDYSAYDHG